MKTISTKKQNGTKALALIAGIALLSGCSEAPSSSSSGETKAEATATSETKTASGGMVLPATTSSDAARDLYMAGWADFENSRFLTANDNFAAAAKADPSFAMAHMMTAWTAPSTEDFVTGVGNASANTEGASDGEKLLVKMVESFLAADAEGAIAATKKLTEMHPDSPRAWHFMAAAHANVQDSKNTRAAYKKVIKLDPEYVPGHINLGNNLMTQEPKDFAAAETHFRHAIALTPNEPNPYDLLGDVHRAQGNLKAAYVDYSKAAELAPTLGSGLQQRGHVNSFLGNYDEARADYTKATELEDARGSSAGPSFDTFRAYVNLHEGNHDAAIAELRALADGLSGSTKPGANDQRVNALLNIALIAIEAGNKDVASAALRDASATQLLQADELESTAIRDAAGATRSHFEGLLSARMGDSKNAAAHVEDFKKFVATSNNPQKLQRMHNIMGMDAYYQGQYAGAATHLAQGTHVNNMYIKYYLARAHEQAGNMDEAKKLYNEMAVYNFNGPGYAMFRKDILKRTGG